MSDNPQDQDTRTAHDRLVASHAQLLELLERVAALLDERRRAGTATLLERVARAECMSALAETMKVFGQPATTRSAEDRAEERKDEKGKLNERFFSDPYRNPANKA